MWDRFNDRIDRFNLRKSLISGWGSSLHKNPSNGLNKGLWVDYGLTDHCISVTNIKYKEFQYFQLPRPIKDK